MNKFICKIHLTFLFLLCIFGAEFLKFKLIISNFPLYFEFAISVVHIFLNLKHNQKLFLNKTEKNLIIFIIYVSFIIFLSILGFNKIFAIENIAFNKKMIINQTYMISLLPIALSLYYTFINNYEYIYNLLKKKCGYLLLVILLLSFIGLCQYTVTTFVIAILLNIYFKEKQNLMNKFIFIIFSIYYLLHINGGTTSYLILICCFIFVYNNKIIKIIENHKKFLLLMMFLIVCAICINYKSVIILLKNIDANFWWRFIFWIDNIKILKKTYLLGIGYGVTYGDSSLFKILSGGFIDPETGLPINSLNVLFTTAQHNSYINILYRTGIIGLILFLRVTFDLLFKTQKYINNNFDKTIYMMFINANILILFNVGLESPQFLILYYLSISSLLAIRKINSKKSKNLI